ncbi:MAG: response regulator [Planctomycetota bacterium]
MKNKPFPTILVADKDPASLSQTVRILDNSKFNVFSAICHASAMSAAVRLELDLIICDLKLWIGDPGQDLIADILRLPKHKGIPVLFTSGGQEADVIRRKHDFGGAYHVKKPFDTVVFLELIERAIGVPHLVNNQVQSPHFSLPGAGFIPDTSLTSVES